MQLCRIQHRCDQILFMKTLYENSKNETCFSCDAMINSGLLYRIFELRFQGTRICLNGSFYIQKVECLSDILLGPVAASQRPSGLVSLQHVLNLYT